MGQKSSPIILRLSLLRNWSSNWYAEDKITPFLCGFVHSGLDPRVFLGVPITSVATRSPLVS
ncbi:MAG: hypothetical protein Q8886_02760 [Candidatus Phytoplasma australasiaticum]|nr:hypothetical protein [Candidatus Phytoplasma australasiaticum]